MKTGFYPANIITERLTERSAWLPRLCITRNYSRGSSGSPSKKARRSLRTIQSRMLHNPRTPMIIAMLLKMPGQSHADDLGNLHSDARASTPQAIDFNDRRGWWRKEAQTPVQSRFVSGRTGPLERQDSAAAQSALLKLAMRFGGFRDRHAHRHARRQNALGQQLSQPDQRRCIGRLGEYTDDTGAQARIRDGMA